MIQRATTFALADGHILEIYEPPSSGQDAMRRGRCPECGGQLHGFRGRYAAIREVDADGLVVAHSAFACNYGHLVCIQQRFDALITSLRAPGTVPYGLDWNRGTQRDMIAFIKRHAHNVVEVCFDPEASRFTHYEFRVRENS